MIYKQFSELYKIPSRNGLTKPKVIRGSGTKMVNMGEIFAHSRLINAEMDRVPLNEAERSTSLLRKGDLLFARQSLVLSGAGKCSIFLDDNEDVCFESHIIRCRLNPEYADPKYYYYFFNSPIGRATISTIVEQGAGASGIRGTDLAEISVPWVDVQIQQNISRILSALDDKITNNAKINHHLEQMAQAIFKSWFVDFEPFGGEMPDDWKAGSLLDIADYLNGLAMQRFRPTEGEVGLPVLKIKELRQGVCDSSSELCSPSIRQDYIVHDGDVIFSWSGSLLVDFWCGGDCGLNQHLFKVTSTKYDKWFYYGWTCHHLAQFIAMAADKATTMGHIKREALANAEVFIPSDKDYAILGELLAPLYERVVNNRVESRKLALLRDSLLPRLMSGELSLEGVYDE